MTVEGRESYIELRKQANFHLENITRSLDEIQRLNNAGILCDRWLGLQVMAKFSRVFPRLPTGTLLMSEAECREIDELLAEGHTLIEAVRERRRRQGELARANS